MGGGVSHDKNAEVAAKLQALRQSYADRLPEELESLNSLAQALLSNEDRPQALSELKARLHKLAGSAGSFGYAALGQEARRLELALQGLSDQAPDPQRIAALVHRVTHLGDELVQVSDTRLVPQTSLREQGERHNRLFLLEDDPQVAEEIAESLRHFGHSVSVFAELGAAELAILANPPDFILADIFFLAEGRDSPELIEKLQRGRKAPIPVIFMSSRTDFDAYLAAARAGAIRYFTKPLDVAKLVDFLEDYLDARRSAPFRVLIVDDDGLLAGHYRQILEAAGMLVETLADPTQVLPKLDEFHPEVILLDLHMPRCPGTDLAKVIRLTDSWLQVPIVYLSAETDIDRRIQAVGHSGDDFLAKPISDKELVSAVKVRAARARQLSHVIDLDSLTGLLKHARAKEELVKEVARAKRQGQALSLAMIDLDHFKRVNDSWGHPAGDKVIRALAHLLRQRLRKTDVLGRYGGEEFIAILPGCPIEEASRLLDAVRCNFEALMFQAGQDSFQLTLSVGLAGNERGELAAEELLNLADNALYRAKREGRNRVVVA